MRKNTEPPTETKAQRRDRAIVQVPLRDVKDEPRRAIEAIWDAREAKARELRNIHGTKGRANMKLPAPTADEAMRGAMQRVESKPQTVPKKAKRDLGGSFTRPDEDDTTVSTGPATDDRVNTGEFVRGPETETVDVGGVPVQRRRR